MSSNKSDDTITCRVVADKVWFSKESRFLAPGDEVEFPAKVKNHLGQLVDFKVGESFEMVGSPSKKTKPPAADLV